MQRMSYWFDRLRSGAIRSLSDLREAVFLTREASEPEDTSFDRFLGTLGDGAVFDAPTRLRFPWDATAEEMLRRHAMADWQNVDPRIARFGAALIEVARKQGIPLYVHTAFRTRAEQEAAVSRGVSKARWPRAAHCQGAAVDIVHGRFHWQLTNGEWALLGKLGKDVAQRLRVPVVWGGDWSFFDPAHWELAGWQDRVREDLPEGEPWRRTPRSILRSV